MAQKAKNRSEDLLQKLKLVDTTERVIRSIDKIEVYCRTDCGIIGLVMYNNLVAQGSWVCKSCQKTYLSEVGKNRIGESNPFYGKVHKKEVKVLLAQKQSERQSGLSTEDKAKYAEFMKIGRNIAFNGKNPMDIEEIRKRHHDATRTKEFIESAYNRGIYLASQDGFSEKMGKQAKDWWDSDKSNEFRILYKKFVDEQLNNPNGKFYQKRISGLHEFYKDQIRVNLRFERFKNTVMKRFGVENPMQNSEIWKKANSHRGPTKPERMMMEFLTNRGIEFKYEEESNGKHWDITVYLDGVKKLIIEIDGEYNHGLKSDPNSTKVSGIKDATRFERVGGEVPFLVIDSQKVKKSFQEVIRLLGVDYDAWINEIYDACAGAPFPYPSFAETRLLRDWKNLKSIYTDKYNPNFMPCNSIITLFHKSIYSSRLNGRISPIEAWNDPQKLRKCIENRFIYASNLSSQSIARGFEKNKLAPRVSVFQPFTAKYLLNKYAPDSKTVVDPFSGFSGRMLGATCLGKSYTGYDIRKEAIDESKQIVKLLDISDLVSLTTRDFDYVVDKNEYDVLLTCPPYKNKERWSDDQNCKSAAYYIKRCLKKFKAKKYIFVVDDPEEYKDFVKEEIHKKSHLSKGVEYIVVIDGQQNN